MARDRRSRGADRAARRGSNVARRRAATSSTAAVDNFVGNPPSTAPQAARSARSGIDCSKFRHEKVFENQSLASTVTALVTGTSAAPAPVTGAAVEFSARAGTGVLPMAELAASRAAARGLERRARCSRAVADALAARFARLHRARRDLRLLARRQRPLLLHPEGRRRRRGAAALRDVPARRAAARLRAARRPAGRAARPARASTSRAASCSSSSRRCSAPAPARCTSSSCG